MCFDAQNVLQTDKRDAGGAGGFGQQPVQGITAAAKVGVMMWLNMQRISPTHTAKQCSLL